MFRIVQRFANLNISKFGGLNLNKTVPLLQRLDGERSCELFADCESFRSHHSVHSKNMPNVNLAAIFDSTKIKITDKPLVPNKLIIDPTIISNLAIIDKPCSQKTIEEPETSNVIEKQAVTMIIIRKKKMRKHKLRKLRKRMKFEWARRAQRREKIKELAFLSELTQEIKKAEAFSPAKYAAESRALIKQTFRHMKYEKMPDWYYNQLMETEKRLAREAAEDAERDKMLEKVNKIYREKGTLS